MNENLIPVKEIPPNVKYDSTLEIVSNNVSYFTHGFFKYPCKFIPHIPRWAILKYANEGELVLDPFAGSGTTLVESVLNKRNALGVDFDKFSQLLCKTKTTLLSEYQIKYLNELEEKTGNKSFNSDFMPDIRNLEHWFPKVNILHLSQLKEKIDYIYEISDDEDIYNFLLVCFASIVRKCSYADDTSPKPYVSSRIKKTPLKVNELFDKTLNSYIKRINEYEGIELGKSQIISDDARNIKSPKYKNKVSLAVTSPPYINAFDYVRSLRLENVWLGFYGDSNILDIKKRQIGTELIPSSVYNEHIELTGNEKLDSIIKKIYIQDKKRAYVVFKFFEDMKLNLIEVKKLLKKDSHYIIVVGNSKIRGIDVPTHEILGDIAKEVGFDLDNQFSYIIKNRYLRIPRSGKGGLIKKDWILDLIKNG